MCFRLTKSHRRSALQAASAFGKFDKFSVRANATSREVIAGALGWERWCGLFVAENARPLTRPA